MLKKIKFDENSDIAAVKKHFRSRVLQLRHSYMNQPPTFPSHHTTNEQLTKMSMYNGYELLTKYATTGTVKIDMKQMKNLPGIDIVNECERIRDELQVFASLPPIVDQTIVSKPNDRKTPSR